MNRALAYVPAIIWAGLLLFTGGRSDIPTVDSPVPLDKPAHFVMYGVLGALATLGWQRAGRAPRLLWVLALACAVGVVDEVHQRQVEHRSAEVADWVADTLGIGAAAWLILRITRDNPKHVV